MSSRVMTVHMKKLRFSFRIDPWQYKRLHAATQQKYAPSMTKIIERGIDLALQELSKMLQKSNIK